MACQVLIKRTDNRGEDGQAWKRGDPVVVMPERHIWGRREDPATSDKFYVVLILDMDVREVERWFLDTLEDEEAHEEDPRQLRLRKYRLDIPHMPQEQQGGIEQDGVLEGTMEEIGPHIRNMETGQHGDHPGTGPGPGK